MAKKGEWVVDLLGEKKVKKEKFALGNVKSFFRRSCVMFLLVFLSTNFGGWRVGGIVVEEDRVH